jgi:Cu+-exporting ATPase
MFLVPVEKGAEGGHEHGGHVHSGRDHAAHGHHAHGHREGSAASLAGGKYDTVPAGWTGAVYTCPMHPEVRQTKAGACPLWGMGLQLVAGSAADEGANPELVDFELGSRKEVRWQGIRQRVVAIAETRFAISQADHVPSGGVTP